MVFRWAKQCGCPDANIISASEMLPEPYQGVGIETAIIEKLSANLILARRPGLRMDSLKIRSHGHAAVLDAIEFFIAKIRRDCGQHALKAPTPLLRWVIVISPGDRQEVDNARTDGKEGSR